MVEYHVLRILYIRLPFSPSDDDIRSTINSLGSSINAASMAFGYRFTGAVLCTTELGTWPTKIGPFDASCVDLWFRREGSPAIPAQIIIGIISVALAGVVVYLITVMSGNKVLETQIRTTQEIYDECVSKRGDPVKCADAVAKIQQSIGRPESPLETLKALGYIMAIAVGGYIAINIIKELRR